ncbi:MAG: DNA-processing protein DprA [Minisyncoccia bacterium]
MSYEIRILEKSEWPELLNEIPDPPAKLRCAGNLPPKENKLLTIVGSREMTPYGKEVIAMIVGWLRGQPVSIVSGLAFGVDYTAHRCALKEGLHAICIPGSGLSQRVMYPRTNQMLAYEIIENGGLLLSEFDDEFRATPWSFLQRNRIIAGISHVTLIIEAKERSGALATARLALNYNRDVAVVPGNIFSPQSQGVNKLLRDGAHAILEKQDILNLLGLKEKEIINTKGQQTLFGNLSQEEKEILDILQDGALSTDLIIAQSSMSASTVLAIISSLSLKGLVRESMGEIAINN